MTQLGIVTYNIAKDWDLPTILSRLEKLGYAGVELRTGQAHKVEVNLTGAQREEVRKRFAEELRPDPPLCRPPERPRLLELESDRCGERLDQRNICPGRLQGAREAGRAIDPSPKGPLGPLRPE